MDFIKKHIPLILASKSPRRLELLNSAGIDPIVIESNYEEPERIDELPDEYAKKLSYFKALSVSEKNMDNYVLGADTIVVLKDKILGKPKSKDMAREMIFDLSGKTHEVITGFSLISPQHKKIFTDSVSTSVNFRKLSLNEVEWYINTEEPYDKAGGYGIQGKAGSFVESIDGSYSNVVGLPLSEVIKLMYSERLID